MGSNLHLHVASLRIQDEIRYASNARLATQAKRAARTDAVATVAPRSRWASLRPTYLIGRSS
jgi:hypothetical protein